MRVLIVIMIEVEKVFDGIRVLFMYELEMIVFDEGEREVIFRIILDN